MFKRTKTGLGGWIIGIVCVCVCVREREREREREKGGREEGNTQYICWGTFVDSTEVSRQK